MGAPIKLVAGLGNPGREYARTRHNAGFWFVDELAARLRTSFAPESKFAGEVARAGDMRLVKPTTFMNLSGRSVAALARFFAIAPESILVAHDELDLKPGEAKMKFGGGHAGHNGLRSIQAHLGPDFRRIRMGIGHPGAKERVTGWVLGNFAKVDRDWLEGLLGDVADAAGKLVERDDVGFMNLVMGVKPATEAKPEKPRPQAAPVEGGPPPAAKNAMAETLRRLLAAKKR